MRLVVPHYVFLGVMLILTACGGEGSDAESGVDALTSAAPHAFNPADPRGGSRRTFTTPSGQTEVCIVPKHGVEEDFSDKDKKKEAKLCGIAFNADASTGD